jgi:hypothetical protein
MVQGRPGFCDRALPLPLPPAPASRQHIAHPGGPGGGQSALDVGQQQPKGKGKGARLGQLTTQGTPEGTYTDKGKEGSAKVRTDRLEDIHHWRGCKHQRAREVPAVPGNSRAESREQSKSARTGDMKHEGPEKGRGASAGAERHLAAGDNPLQANC